MNQESYRQESVSFESILKELSVKWKLILVITVICMLLSLVYRQFLVTPQYIATSKLYVISQTNVGQINSGDISVSSYLAKDCSELIVDRSVLSEVIDKLGLKIGYVTLKNAVSVENPEATRFLKISVRTSDFTTSKKIADCICEVAQEKIVLLVGADKVNIIGSAYGSTAPVNMQISSYLFKGFLYGIVLSLLVVLIIIFSNDKIKSEKDIENYLSLNVLAIVPYKKNNASPANRPSSKTQHR